MKQFFDAQHVRYTLVQTSAGKGINWLFLPGGPGGDASYFSNLIELLQLPGNVWLIDLPGNGSNVVEGVEYDRWFEIFPSVVEQFDNPVLVGHSFGGQFPLLFPQLEQMLKGFVILNSAPTLWMEEAVNYAKQFELPDLTEEMQAFTTDPNQETFDRALNACMPYYFPPKTLKKGSEMLAQIPFRYQPAVWWQHKAVELNLSAKWIPESVPTLIVGAKYDCICPYTLFERDERFKRENITHQLLSEAGHCPWVEDPEAIRNAFDAFALKL